MELHNSEYWFDEIRLSLRRLRRLCTTHTPVGDRIHLETGYIRKQLKKIEEHVHELESWIIRTQKEDLSNDVVDVDRPFQLGLFEQAAKEDL